MIFDALARNFSPSRNWRDELADFYQALFRQGESAAAQTDAQTRALVAAVSREIGRLSGQAGAGLTVAERTGRRYARDASKGYSIFEAGLKREVRARPVKAVVVAIAAGVIIGMITSRS